MEVNIVKDPFLKIEIELYKKECLRLRNELDS